MSILTYFTLFLHDFNLSDREKNRHKNMYGDKFAKLNSCENKMAYSNLHTVTLHVESYLKLIVCVKMALSCISLSRCN